MLTIIFHSKFWTFLTSSLLLLSFLGLTNLETVNKRLSIFEEESVASYFKDKDQIAAFSGYIARRLIEKRGKTIPRWCSE